MSSSCSAELAAGPTARLFRHPFGQDSWCQLAAAAGFGWPLPVAGSLNGAVRTRLVTAPLRMHWVQTRSVLLVLPTVACTVCRFGLNWRREMPVILVPTPPKYLALPRMVTELPITGFLPQISQHFPTEPSRLSATGQLGQNSQYIGQPPGAKRKCGVEGQKGRQGGPWPRRWLSAERQGGFQRVEDMEQAPRGPFLSTSALPGPFTGAIVTGMSQTRRHRSTIWPTRRKHAAAADLRAVRRRAVSQTAGPGPAGAAVLAGDDAEFSSTSFAGPTVTLSAVLDELSTLAMFGGGERLVVDRPGRRFRQPLSGRAGALCRASQGGAAYWCWTSASWPSNTRLYKALAGKGLVDRVQISVAGPVAEMADRLGEATVPARGWRADAAEALIEIVEPDLGLFDPELSKLALLAGADGVIRRRAGARGGWRLADADDVGDARSGGQRQRRGRRWSSWIICFRRAKCRSRSWPRSARR